MLHRHFHAYGCASRSLKAKLFDDSDYDFTTFAAEIQIEIFQNDDEVDGHFILEALLEGHRRWRVSTALARQRDWFS